MARDPITGDLFEPPAPAATPGSMHYAAEVAGLVGQMLKAATGDRYDVAADMSRLTGRECSKYMLDAWAAESRDAYNLPLYLTPALETACASHALSQWLAARRGGRLLIGRETLDAELGRLERVRDEAGRRIKTLKQIMEAGRDS